MSFTQLYIMYIRIRCNFRLEVYNRNTNHCPTMVTSRQPVNVPTPNHSFTHSPFKCCSKHLNASTQSRLARDHHKSTKTITKTKEIRSKYIYIYIYIQRERERERERSQVAEFEDCLLVSLMRTSTRLSIIELNQWIALIAHSSQQ